MNTTPHKVWITPQVFVLGAQGTEAYKQSATNEYPTVNTYYTKVGDSTYTPVQVTTYVGFQS